MQCITMGMDSMLQIGNVKLKNRLVLAPLADITSLSFRLLCKRYGVALVVSEMINANALSRNNKATVRLTLTAEEEKPIALQIFGQNTEHLVSAAHILEKQADMIDLNAGCPVDKVMRQGAGAALLKRPAKLGTLVEELSSTLKIPLTVKIRTGLTKKSAEPVKIAKIIERSGAAAITLHARTQDQQYSGKADWSMIKLVKENVSIPVIGNGDVTSAQKCKDMIDQTGCDFVMIGRAVMGNPYLFKQCIHYLEKGELLPDQTPDEKIDDFLWLVDSYKKYEDGNLENVKRRAMDFSKGFENSAKTRLEISRLNTAEEIVEKMKSFKKG